MQIALCAFVELRTSLSDDPMVIDNPSLISKLRALIGQCVALHGESYQVIEVLPERPAIVLQSLAEDKVIQANAQGEASRRVPRIVEVPARLGGEDLLDPRVAAWLEDLPR